MKQNRLFRAIVLSGSALPLVFSIVFPMPAIGRTQTVASPKKHALPDPSGKKSAHHADAEQIQVTGVSRTVNVQKTPTSVSVVSAQTLDHSNVTSLSGLNGMAPGLNIAKTSGYQTNIQIRGVGMQTPENTATTSTGVAVYIDGVYIANSVSLDQTFFDLDSIAIYRGPQATEYGQSAPGGAIVISTAQPTMDKFSGHLEASGGNYDLARGRAELNVPISSTLAIRGSFQSFSHSGFGHFNSPYIGGFGVDDAQDNSGKLAIKWQPSDNFSATLTGQWYNSTPHGAEQKNILDPSTNPRVVNQDYPESTTLTTTFYHLNLNWKTAWGELTSVTATQHVHDHQQYDNARLAERIFGKYDILPKNDNSVNNYSETLMFKSNHNKRFDWDVGLFLMGQRAHSYTSEFGGTSDISWPNFAVPDNIVSDPPSNLTYGNKVTSTRMAIQPFVDLNYNITSRLHLRGGARFNYDRYSTAGLSFAASGSSSSQHSSSTKVPTWKAELDYDLARGEHGIESMGYFSVATGYKPGGVNGNPSAKVISPIFKPEKILNYEIGVKNWFFDHHLMFNVSAFYANYKNMQFIADDPVPYAYGVANVPKIHLYGIEMESSYLALHDRFHLDGSLTLERSKIASDYHTIDAAEVSKIYASSSACANGAQYYSSSCWAAVEAASPNVRGNQAPGMPNVQASLSASYLWDVPGGTLMTRAQYIYRGNYSSRVFDNPLLDHVPAYFLFNAFLEYRPKATRWYFSLAATNLANTAGVNSRFTDPYGTYQTSEQYIAPRQFIGTVGVSF